MIAENRKLHHEVGNLELFLLNAIVATSKVNELNSVVKCLKMYEFLLHSVQTALVFIFQKLCVYSRFSVFGLISYFLWIGKSHDHF